MDYQQKTREELLFMLVKLEKEHTELKELYHLTDKSQLPVGVAESKHLPGRLIDDEEKFRHVFEYSTIGTSITTLEGRIQTNKAFCQILGYTEAELSLVNWAEITHPDDIQPNIDKVKLLLSGEEKSARWEKRYIHKNGNVVWVDISTTIHRDSNDKPLYFITSVFDITSHYLAGEALNESSSRLELAMKSANMASWGMDVATGEVTFDQPKTEMLGYPARNFKHYNDFMALVHPEDSERMIDAMRSHLLGAAEKFEVEYRILSQSGEYFWFYEIGSVVKRDAEGKPLQVTGLVIDISRQKKTEQELLKAKEKAEESEKYIRLVADNLVNGMIYQVVTLDDDIRIFTYLSDSVSKLYGCTPEEAKADANLIYGRIYKDDIERVLKEENAAKDSMTVFKTELRLVDLNGNIRWSSLVSSPRMYKGLIYWDGIEIDITDRKQSEIKLRKANRLYNVISQVSQASVHIKVKDQLLKEVCRIAVEYGNFRMSWVGLFDEPDKVIKPVTWAGHEDGYLGLIRQISFGNEPEGRGPMIKAISQGKYFVCNDFENDPNVSLWKEEALKRNYYSSIGLPIKFFGEIIGVFMLYASVRDFFDEEEIELLLEVANDISYALEAMELGLKHQQAASALAVSEKKYREITENVKDVVWVMDPETMYFTYVSPSVEKLRGYSAEEVMAAPVLQSIDPEFRESIQKMIETRVSEVVSEDVTSEINYTFEVKQPCRDGSTITTEVVAYYLVNEETGKLEIHGLSRDITDRKLAEESLRRSEERFHGIFNNLQDAFFQADMWGKISLVSPSSAKIYGYDSVDEMIGIPVANLYADGDDRLELINEISVNGGVVDYIAEAVRKDGTTFRASLNVQFRYEDDKISGTEGVVRDITERKMQEDRINTLSSAVEQSPVVVVITDIDGFIEYVNPKFSEVTGYSVEEVLGQNPRILKSADKSTEDYQQLWNTILSGNVWHGEFRNKKKNGEIYYEAATISPITDDQGIIKHFLAVKEDITEKRQLINDLINAKVRAEESDRLKSAFLANMSHEIRTPMNGIMGFTELLKEPNLSGREQKAYIQVIEESGDRMLNLMNNLIDISRIESGEINVLISSYNIKKQLDNIYNFFAPEANKKGLKLICNYNLATVDSIIETDMQKLDSIVINLVKNALKFTRQGGVEFGCTREGSNYLFFVKDTGIGIDSGYKEIIFDRFRQASESLSRPYEGAGLGLSISKAFVESLGGKIWVESEVGNGSTFSFIIPGILKTTEGISDQGADVLLKIQNQQEELKVLIVEDDEISLHYMEIIIGSFCTKFFKARTGLEAVEIFSSNLDVNLILMDIKMPVMDGFEATRQIRQLNTDVVIIAQTAYSMVGDREKALEAGCTDYISKPVNKDKLKELIRIHTKYKGKGSII